MFFELMSQKLRVEWWLPGAGERREGAEMEQGWSLGTKSQLKRRNEVWRAVTQKGDFR
jgi:hypothetical protein